MFRATIPEFIRKQVCKDLWGKMSPFSFWRRLYIGTQFDFCWERILMGEKQSARDVNSWEELPSLCGLTLMEHSNGWTVWKRLNFSISSFVIRVNLLHPKPSLFLYGLLLCLCCFFYLCEVFLGFLQFKTTQNTVTMLLKPFSYPVPSRLFQSSTARKGGVRIFQIGRGYKVFPQETFRSERTGSVSVIVH